MDSFMYWVDKIFARASGQYLLALVQAFCFLHFVEYGRNGMAAFAAFFFLFNFFYGTHLLSKGKL